MPRLMLDDDFPIADITYEMAEGIRQIVNNFGILNLCEIKYDVSPSPAAYSASVITVNFKFQALKKVLTYDQ